MTASSYPDGTPVARTILVLVGLPASGKSTYASKLLRSEPDRWIRVSRDDLRAMIVAADYAHAARPTREELLRQIKFDIARAALRLGFDVILDDTHLFPGALERVHDFAKAVAAEGTELKIVQKCFPVALEQCLNRNARRPASVRPPRRVLLRMATVIEDRPDLLSYRETIYRPLRFNETRRKADQ